MANIFNNLEIEAFRAGITPRTKESIEWFRKRASTIRRVNRQSLMSEDPLEYRTSPRPGHMFMFFYDPKTKETLPYYDKFPLIIMVQRAPGGFHGLNLHYLPPILRARFLDELFDTLNNKRFDESTRFRITYGLLKRAMKFKYFKPCFKHYLLDHVKGRFSYVPPTEWEIASFLPTADFAKASKANVYSKSRASI